MAISHSPFQSQLNVTLKERDLFHYFYLSSSPWLLSISSTPFMSFTEFGTIYKTLIYFLIIIYLSPSPTLVE